jgi:hypothetical protein
MTARSPLHPPPEFTAPWELLARPRIFWLGVAAVSLVALVSAKDPDFADLFGFFIITATALLPAFLWCRGLAHGIPIYPVFTLGTVGTFALPLISHHPLVIQYEADERLTAAVTVAATNLTGTVFWYFLSRRRRPLGPSYLGFRPGSGDPLFFAILIAAIAFNIITTSFDLQIDPSIFSLLRAIILALANLGIFVLGCRAGQRTLGRGGARFYFLLILFLILSTLPTGLMIGALSNALLALIGFALGRGRLPWFGLACLLAAALFLQAGKTAIRAKYWRPDSGGYVTVIHYPEFFSDWITLSSKQLFAGRETVPGFEDNTDENNFVPQSIVERSSLMHLFLRIQRMTPGQVPHLVGATYAIIPELLIPRIFDEQKERAHLGTYMLAIHYGLQRPEDTAGTTIGFGLINEALANFGYVGCLGLGAVLGLFFGWIARWSSSSPLLSFRAFFAIITLASAFQNEYTAGVFVTTLFQGWCALLFLSAITMRRVPAPSLIIPHPDRKSYGFR